MHFLIYLSTKQNCTHRRGQHAVSTARITGVMTGVVSACDTYAVESDNLEFIFENWLQKFEPGGFGELKGEYMYIDMVSRWKRAVLYYIGSKNEFAD